MINKTHLAIGTALLLLFVPHVNHKLLFIPIILLASILPDIDSAYSQVGHIKVFRPMQWFVKHRGFLHSFTMCFVFSLLLALFLPTFALPFFLGYFGHVFADSFTIDGIRPFWPLKGEISGHLRTGGAIEEGIFFGLIFFDIVLFLAWFL